MPRGARRRRRHPWRLSLLLLLLAVGGFAPRLDALPLTSGGSGDERKTPDRRLYVGMWTIHFRDLDRGVENNWLVGLSWGRIYGATFINSFGKRAYSAGMQGDLARWDSRMVSIGLGYRAGLVTGYDKRFIRLADKTPVLPLLQPLLNVDAKRLGLELSYSGVVASAGLNLRL
jgi:hypothetical protein